MACQLLRTAVLCAVTCAGSLAVDPQVTTLSGALKGTELKSFLNNTFYSFKGIPYAEPPVGELRFRAPQPHRGWTEVREAKQHGSTCMQFATFAQGVVEGSEDCLFLNVYTPVLPAGDRRPQLPVLVWIHGGGFYSGSGNSDVYGPDYLMDEQVVVVTLNYRLGAFGFFTTADASAPGNYGLHDQVLALEWVQANIAAFGGDPAAVTIFGESAGGASVGLQVLSPRSRGLFAKAISQSGASFCNFGASGEPQGQNAKRHAQLLRCPVDSSRETVSCMRHKPADEILKSTATLQRESQAAMPKIFYKPRVDTDSQTPFLPVDPYVALKSGDFNRVPWLTGLTENEGALFVFMLSNNPQAMEIYRSRDWERWATSLLDIENAAPAPSAIAETLHRRYFGDADVGENTLLAFSDLLSDRWIANCVFSEANLAAAHTPVFMYVLDYNGAGRQSFIQTMTSLLGMADLRQDLGVTHADDLLYLFRGMFTAPVERESDGHKIIRFMVSVWTSFARRGHPTTDVLSMPSWPVYSSDRQEYMRLNLAPSVAEAAFRERREFWQQLDIHENWQRPLTAIQRDEL